MPGEDEVSFQRHNKALQLEYKKTRPNPQVVRELMTTTFAMRRADLLSKAYDVLTVFEKYPFLNDVDQVLCCYVCTSVNYGCAFAYVCVDNGRYADDCWLYFVVPDFTSQVGGSNGENCATCRV